MLGTEQVPESRFHASLLEESEVPFIFKEKKRESYVNPFTLSIVTFTRLTSQLVDLPTSSPQGAYIPPSTKSTESSRPPVRV